MNKIELLYIDLFCGAGGTSSGVEYATVDGRKCAEVIACVNHDENAIKSHAANHPKTMHFTEDIRTLDLAPLVALLEYLRRHCHPVRNWLYGHYHHSWHAEIDGIHYTMLNIFEMKELR